MPSPSSLSRSASETDAAEITARILLETESVLFRPDEPFTFTSGLRSPVYIDCRRLISFPRARRKLMDLAAELIERHSGFESLDGDEGDGLGLGGSLEDVDDEAIAELAEVEDPDGGRPGGASGVANGFG